MKVQTSSLKVPLCLLATLLLLGCHRGAYLINNGNIAYRNGDSDSAVKLYREAAEFGETRNAALLNLGRVLVEQGKAEQALPFLNEALATAPDDALGYYNRAQARLALDENSEEAETDLRKCTELDPIFGPAWMLRAKRKARQGDISGALELVKYAIPDPAMVEEATWLSVEWRKGQGDTEGVISDLERLTRSRPFVAKAWFEMGYALLELPDYREAERALRRGLSLDSTSIEARLALAQALAGSGRRKVALDSVAPLLELELAPELASQVRRIHSEILATLGPE